jgi:hypothetical protein
LHVHLGIRYEKPCKKHTEFLWTIQGGIGLEEIRCILWYLERGKSKCKVTERERRKGFNCKK